MCISTTFYQLTVNELPIAENATPDFNKIINYLVSQNQFALPFVYFSLFEQTTRKLKNSLTKTKEIFYI